MRGLFSILGNLTPYNVVLCRTSDKIAYKLELMDLPNRITSRGDIWYSKRPWGSANTGKILTSKVKLLDRER
jgi:hypothetical protein